MDNLYDINGIEFFVVGYLIMEFNVTIVMHKDHLKDLNSENSKYVRVRHSQYLRCLLLSNFVYRYKLRDVSLAQFKYFLKDYRMCPHY